MNIDITVGNAQERSALYEDWLEGHRRQLLAFLARYTENYGLSDEQIEEILIRIEATERDVLTYVPYAAALQRLGYSAPSRRIAAILFDMYGAYQTFVQTYIENWMRRRQTRQRVEGMERQIATIIEGVRERRELAQRGVYDAWNTVLFSICPNCKFIMESTGDLKYCPSCGLAVKP